MDQITIEAVPNEAELLEISKLAHARHLHFITNGVRAALCSIIPPGWSEILTCEKNNQQSQVVA